MFFVCDIFHMATCKIEMIFDGIIISHVSRPIYKVSFFIK